MIKSLLYAVAKLVYSIGEYRIHPSILDATIHITVHPIITGYKKDSRYYLPSKVGWLATHEALDQRPFPKSVLAHVTLVGSNTSEWPYIAIFACTLTSICSFSHV